MSHNYSDIITQQFVPICSILPIAFVYTTVKLICEEFNELVKSNVRVSVFVYVKEVEDDSFRLISHGSIVKDNYYIYIGLAKCSSTMFEEVKVFASQKFDIMCTVYFIVPKTYQIDNTTMSLCDTKCCNCKKISLNLLKIILQ